MAKPPHAALCWSKLSRHVLVDQKRLAGVFDLRDGAFEVEGFGEDDLEDLMDVLT